MIRQASRFWIAAAAALLASCSSLYFESAGPAPDPPPRYRLDAWPDREYWSGLVFNGEKIGFSHLELAASAAEAGRYEIRSEAAFVLRFMGYEKRVNLKAHDVVDDTLALQRFRYDYSLDGSDLALVGERRGDTLEVTVRHGGTSERQTLALAQAIYPQSAIGLYPTLHGLAPGRVYRYPVYSGELQQIAEVEQRIEAWQRTRLFDGEAFRVETSMEGYRVTTWLSATGRPMLEIGMNGVLISGLEDEARAKRYLAGASLNKSEALIDFALIRVSPPLASPRAVTAMRIALAGASRDVPSDDVQRCARADSEIMCEVGTGEAASADPPQPRAEARHLASTFPVPARDPAIVALARTIGDGREPRAQVERIVAWIGANVRASPVDVWTALDALAKREAECQGRTYLYAALARALGIPTRVLNGIVYSEQYDGFLYHTWAESLVDGRWIAVDPTFGTVPADATHVALVEGETLAEVTPLVDWVGQLRVRVLSTTR